MQGPCHNIQGSCRNVLPSASRLPAPGSPRRRLRKGHAALWRAPNRPELLALAASLETGLIQPQNHTRWTPALKTTYASLRTTAELTVCEAAAAGSRQPASTSFFGEDCFSSSKSAAAGARAPRGRAPRRALVAAKPQNASERAAASIDRHPPELARPTYIHLVVDILSYKKNIGLSDQFVD